MKVIIAGSRHFADAGKMAEAIKSTGLHIHITEVVSGCARGADTLGEKWASQFYDIKVKRFPADWDRYGKRAGFMRNGEMAAYAEALIAFPIGKSRGTRDMIRQAKKYGLSVFVVE